jgi:hypothetical protein
MKTLLDAYKERMNVEHDGNAILDAASNGKFLVNNKGYRFVVHRLLERLGVQEEMTRDQVIVCLNGRLREDDPHLQKIIDEEAEKWQFNDTEVTMLPSAEPNIKKIVRQRIEQLLNDVVCFCETSAEEEKKKPGVLTFLKDVIK